MMMPNLIHALWLAALLALPQPGYAADVCDTQGEKLSTALDKETAVIKAEYEDVLVKAAIDEKSAGSYVHAKSADEATEIARKRIVRENRAEKLGVTKKAEQESLAHQEDLIEGLNKDVRPKLEAEGFDTGAFIRGSADSDMGKLDTYKALLLEKSAKSDLLLETLTGRGPSKSSAAMRELLDNLGFKDKWLLNPEMTADNLRELFKSVPMLQGFLHELPGMADAILLFERGALTNEQFKTQIGANLFHNGPQEGFWKFFTEVLVPGQYGIGGNPKAHRFFAGTVFEGATDATGVVKPAYSSPRTYEGAVHSVFDRMSQATQGGVTKMFEEIRTKVKIDIKADLEAMRNFMVDNPKNTRAQIQRLADDSDQLVGASAGAKTNVKNLAASGIERVQKYEAWIAANSEVVRTADNKGTTSIRMNFENKTVTFVTENGKAQIIIEPKGKKPIVRTFENNDVRFSNELAKTSDDFLKLEEIKNGDAVRGLSLDSKKANNAKPFIQQSMHGLGGETTQIGRRPPDPAELKAWSENNQELGDSRWRLLPQDEVQLRGKLGLKPGQAIPDMEAAAYLSGLSDDIAKTSQGAMEKLRVGMPDIEARREALAKMTLGSEPYKAALNELTDLEGSVALAHEQLAHSLESRLLHRGVPVMKKKLADDSYYVVMLPKIVGDSMGIANPSTRLTRLADAQNSRGYRLGFATKMAPRGRTEAIPNDIILLPWMDSEIPGIVSKTGNHEFGHGSTWKQLDDAVKGKPGRRDAPVLLISGTKKLKTDVGGVDLSKLYGEGFYTDEAHQYGFESVSNATTGRRFADLYHELALDNSPKALDAVKALIRKDTGHPTASVTRNEALAYLLLKSREHAQKTQARGQISTAFLDASIEELADAYGKKVFMSGDKKNIHFNKETRLLEYKLDNGTSISFACAQVIPGCDLSDPAAFQKAFGTFLSKEVTRLRKLRTTLIEAAKDSRALEVWAADASPTGKTPPPKHTPRLAALKKRYAPGADPEVTVASVVDKQGGEITQKGVTAIDGDDTVGNPAQRSARSAPTPDTTPVTPPRPGIEVKSTPDTYWVVDPKNRYFQATGTIDEQGVLNVLIRTENNSGSIKSDALRGSVEYENMLKHFGSRVKAIRGNWKFGTNLGQVNKLTKPPHSLPLEEAVKQTWTAKRAADAGFTEVSIEESSHRAGKYTDVVVVFKRPKTAAAPEPKLSFNEPVKEAFVESHGLDEPTGAQRPGGKKLGASEPPTPPVPAGEGTVNTTSAEYDVWLSPADEMMMDKIMERTGTDTGSKNGTVEYKPQTIDQLRANDVPIGSYIDEGGTQIVHEVPGTGQVAKVWKATDENGFADPQALGTIPEYVRRQMGMGRFFKSKKLRVAVYELSSKSGKAAKGVGKGVSYQKRSKGLTFKQIKKRHELTSGKIARWTDMNKLMGPYRDWATKLGNYFDKKGISLGKGDGSNHDIKHANFMYEEVSASRAGQPGVVSLEALGPDRNVVTHYYEPILVDY